ncbi:hypothetical protein BKA56DRAFT_624055 [Ilyonectria sp. MPI-CAGE-AT-0026]|nr:hypothetical protein BKA56DRAFT_624055 [Ilyonectria sp. MPI-CAGE-AT-0026]
MSGFEVAGIVLGSIPLVVSALEYYMKGLGTLQNFRSYKRVLKSLILTLDTEHVSLQNVCEKLLVGIAPQTCIEEMIDDPFGELWREEEIFNKLRLRLWRSFKIFYETVRDMREAIEEMMEKLHIGTSGKVEWTESTSIKKQFKRASFILQKSNHEAILTRIRDGVSALQRLAMLNVELEPDRKSRSQGRLNKLVNELSNSIYHALRSTMTCKCPSLHDVGLRLAPPSRTIIPEDDDDEIIKELQFRLAISHMGKSQTPFLMQWNELLLQISQGPEKKQTTSVTTQVKSSAKKSVKFSMSSSASSTASGTQSTQTSFIIQSAMSNLTLSTTKTITDPGQPRRINDLCEAMRRMGKQKCGEQCGHIQDCRAQKNRQYGVYMLDSPGTGDEWALVPLKDVLQDPNLLYGDKLRLAWTIACSVLQMHGTPWIPGVPRNDDIYIARKDGVTQYQSVFVLRHLPERVQPDPTNTPTKHSANPFLLSLGILLIELILGQSMESLQTTQVAAIESGVPKHVLDYETANKLLGRVMMVGGSGYYSAVECCLRCDIYQPDSISGLSGLQGETFAGIVGPLEQDLKKSMS